jgi:hypothetical protein
MLWTIILRFAIAGLSEEGMSAKQVSASLLSLS